jgi:hypothetical protein
MVYLRGYSIQIIPKYNFNRSSRNFVRDGADYTSLRHNTEYSLRLSNSNSTNCDAHVWIDGEKVGVWRLRPYQTATIERPANLNRKFTFVKENSYQAVQGNVQTGNFDNGLVKVVFKPEKKYVNYFEAQSVTTENRNLGKSGRRSMSSMNCYRSSSMESDSNSFLSAGGTVLGNKSYQEFTTVDPLNEIDESLITTLYLRIVVDNEYDTDFEPVIVPLNTGAISNQIPTPISNQIPTPISNQIPTPISNQIPTPIPNYDDYYRHVPYYGRPWNYHR